MLSFQSIFSQTNISLNKNSSSSGGNASNLAFDGDLDTAWNQVGYAPAWVSVDLGSISTVNNIVFNVSQSPDGDTAHYVYSSIDGINWQQVDNFNFYTSNHQEFTRNYTNLNGIRYLKVLTTSSPSWVSWYEISVFGTQEPIAPTDGLVAFYPFNNNADDESGNNNNGAINGATTTTDRFGECSKAYSFNGTNNQIVVGNNPIFDLTNTITLSAWVLPNTLSGDIKVLSKFQSGSNSYQLSLYNGTASFQIIRGGSLIWDKCESDILQVNQWQHIVCTYDNSEMKVYVNGILKNTLAITGAIHISTAPVIIGNYNGGNSWFNGKIDNVRIYSTALSNQEVTDLYNAEKPSNLNAQPGITVLVHGFQAGGGIVDNNFDFAKMGHDILQRAGGGIMYKNNKETGQIEVLEGTFDPNKEIVLVYDWKDLSNNGLLSQNFGGDGYLEASADNLFATILKLANPNNAPISYSLQQFLNKPKHIVGHSRGTIINLQLAHRLLYYFPNINIEQMTFLDPHPATAFGDMTGLYGGTSYIPSNLPSVFGVATNCSLAGCLDATTGQLNLPKNILKADNYYRKDGEYEGASGVSLNVFAFDGLPIPSLNNFNREMDNNTLSPVIISGGGAHSNVHKWYRATIDTNIDVTDNEIGGTNLWFGNGVGAPMGANNFMFNECRSSTGFAYSRIGGRYNDLPLINPNHKLTLTQLNQALAEREGLSASNPNGIAPRSVFNGDFHYKNDSGWINNGATNTTLNSVTYILNETAAINYNIGTSGLVRSSLKHSLMYFGGIAEDFKYLKLDAKISTISPTGKGIIKFYDDLGNEISSSSFDLSILNNSNWKTLYFPLPNELKAGNTSDGKVGTFGIFGLDNNASIFFVDNIELLQCTPIANDLYVAMPDPSTLNFADIENDHWAKEGIYKSRNYGLFRGTSNTTFTPNTSLTKAEAITVLVRAGIKLGIISTYNTTGLPYADVTSCNQYFPYIQTAKNLGHLEFTNNFNPNSPITVAQLCVYMDKILQINLHDWNATTPNTPWVLAPTSQYIQSQLSQIVINQPEPEQNAAMRRILHCIDVVKNDNIIDSYRTQNVWTLKDVENINVSSGQTVEVDGTATVTRARMAVASANLFRFVFKKLNNGNAPAGRMANTMNTTNSDPSIDDFIGIGNTFDNKDIPATDTPEAPTQITFNINSGDTLGLQYQSDTDTAGNPQFFYWSMNKNVDSNIANLVSIPINSIQNHRKVNFIAPVVTSPKTWYLYSYLANNKGKIKETVITINVSSTLSTGEVNGILDNVKIYPNPTANLLFIDTTDNQIQKIEIYDLQGRLLKTIKENKEKYQIDISNFTSATYLVKLSTEKGSQTVKVVKK